MKDLIIIGKGPAGISAAIYAKRAKLDVLVIGKDMGALEKAHLIGNYYGIGEEISGEELFNRGMKQAENLGIEVINDEVVSIQQEQVFTVVTKEKEFQSKTVLIAAGSSRIKPNISGIKEYEGKGVSYCAICDAYFYRGKDVAVLGSGEYAAHEVKDLLPHASKISLLTNGEEPKVSLGEQVKIYTQKVKEIAGNEKVTHVLFDDGTELMLEGVFIAMGSAGSADLANKLGVFVENNKIVTDENMKTNVEALYAAGDCTTGIAQIAKAVSDGCIAATDIIRYLRSKKGN